jgi:putative transposase
MDFVSDQLFDGRRFRALTLVDNYSRECLEIEVGQNLKGIDVVAVMERIKAMRGVVPRRIQVDNGKCLQHSLAVATSNPIPPT